MHTQAEADWKTFPCLGEAMFYIKSLYLISVNFYQEAAAKILTMNSAIRKKSKCIKRHFTQAERKTIPCLDVAAKSSIP